MEVARKHSITLASSVAESSPRARPDSRARKTRPTSCRDAEREFMWQDYFAEKCMGWVI